MKNVLEKRLSAIEPYNLDEYTIVVFGAGNTSLLYQKCFEREGIKPVYYIDNNEAKQNTIFQGAEVISIDKLVGLEKTFSKPVLVLICSANINSCEQIKKQLQNNKLRHIMVDEYVFQKNKNDILEVYDLLKDDFSRKVYSCMIEARVHNAPPPEDLVSQDQYFLLPQFLERSEKEVFVDLGAYIGDTLEQYINKKSGVFDAIYAFEPDGVNFSGLHHRAARLSNEWAFSGNKLILENAGVGLVTNTPPPPPR